MDSTLSYQIIAWYEEHRRELPWRLTVDPYLIWVSEIILQQTRVNQGVDYYHRFVERFPDVHTLASADEDEVLRCWQGLGYYSRARNLHRAAKTVVEKHNGELPRNYDAIRSLAGVGDYTAAAIASFAYNLPHAVVDGNVYRVLSRLFGVSTPIDTTKGKREFATLAQALLPSDRPALHNQAVMEFGALQCVPSSPGCDDCPLQGQCAAFERDLVAELPVKSKRVKMQTRYFHYFFVECGGKVFLQKRTGNDVWKGLYEFPLLESDSLQSFEELAGGGRLTTLFDDVGELQLLAVSPLMKHQLTHQTIFARFFTVSIARPGRSLGSLLQVSINAIDRYAVSRLTEMFLEKSSVNSPTAR